MAGNSFYSPLEVLSHELFKYFLRFVQHENNTFDPAAAAVQYTIARVHCTLIKLAA